jgi:replicative DNA helicase
MDIGLQDSTHPTTAAVSADMAGNPAEKILPDGTVTLKSLASEAISQFVECLMEPGRCSGIRTGFKKLDDITGGFRPGSLNLIASHPSAGKSTMLLNVLEEICLNQKIPSLFFCGDMAPLEVVKRFIFERCLFPLNSVRDQECLPCKGDLLRIQQCAIELAKSGLVINERRDLTLDSITTIARKLHSERGIGFIAMDHLHLIQPDRLGASAKSTMATAAAGLKSLARELNLPILATAHLRRASQGRPADIRDLRHGTALAHEADFIGMLEPMGEVQCSDHVVMRVVKNHGSHCGQVDLYRHRLLLRFCEQPPLTEEQEEMIMAWDQYVEERDFGRPANSAASA